MTRVDRRQVAAERRLDGAPRGPDPSPELARIDLAVARAEDLDGPGGRPQLEADDRQQRRLARPVRAEHDPALTGPDRPVERTEDRPPGAPDDESANLDDGRRLVRIASVGVRACQLPVSWPARPRRAEAPGSASGVGVGSSVGGGSGVGRRLRRSAAAPRSVAAPRSARPTAPRDGEADRALGRAGECRFRRAFGRRCREGRDRRRSDPASGPGSRSATGLGSPHVPATRAPHDAPYGWKPPL